MIPQRSPVSDPRWVYRPMIDLIGFAEGTAQVPGNRAEARGYNTTLGYDAYTGGPVDLVSMTLDEVDALQTRMLRHPDNHWNSSAVGWLQIVRKTLRSARARLRLSGKALFDEAMQDRLTCFLLGYRGIDRWLAGRTSQDALINALAQEWASFPTTAGTGHYSGQSARVTVSDVRSALTQTRLRHEGKLTQPTMPNPVPVPSAPPVADTGPFGDVTPQAVQRLAERSGDELQRAAQMIALAQAVQNGWSVRAGTVFPAPPLPPPTSPEGAPSMPGTKNVFQSKTIVGIITMLVAYFFPPAAPLLELFGFGGASLDPALVGDVEALVNSLIAVIGGATSIWGRLTAKTDLKLTGRSQS